MAEIPCQVELLSDRIQSLAGAVNELRDKLNPVMRPQPPVDVAHNAVPTPQPVPSDIPLAARLHKLTDEVSAAMQNVADMICRVGL